MYDSYLCVGNYTYSKGHYPNFLVDTDRYPSIKGKQWVSVGHAREFLENHMVVASPQKLPEKVTVIINQVNLVYYEPQNNIASLWYS